MSERKQRTPAEIIAETEAKLSRLKVKQAKQDAMSNPAVAPLVEELDALRKDIREAKKGLGDGPQSFNARVAKHDAWIEKIEAERLDAEATLSTAELRKTEIEVQMAQVINGLVESSDELSVEA
jgi:capsule polysaccharide export protein KpsE/RkpR|tara:strand:+ start:526 stop:897 length:372 start_codon:yes stop_codon:yes gene_type:complete